MAYVKVEGKWVPRGGPRYSPGRSTSSPSLCPSLWEAAKAAAAAEAGLAPVADRGGRLGLLLAQAARPAAGKSPHLLALSWRGWRHWHLHQQARKRLLARGEEPGESRRRKTCAAAPCEGDALQRELQQSKLEAAQLREENALLRQQCEELRAAHEDAAKRLAEARAVEADLREGLASARTGLEREERLRRGQEEEWRKELGGAWAAALALLRRRHGAAEFGAALQDLGPLRSALERIGGLPLEEPPATPPPAARLLEEPDGRLEAFVRSWVLDTLRRTLPSVEGLGAAVTLPEITELFQEIARQGGLPVNLDHGGLSPRAARERQEKLVRRAVQEAWQAFGAAPQEMREARLSAAPPLPAAAPPAALPQEEDERHEASLAASADEPSFVLEGPSLCPEEPSMGPEEPSLGPESLSLEEEKAAAAKEAGLGSGSLDASLSTLRLPPIGSDVEGILPLGSENSQGFGSGVSTADTLAQAAPEAAEGPGEAVPEGRGDDPDGVVRALARLRCLTSELRAVSGT